jgi:serine/threonine-protein kinase
VCDGELGAVRGMNWNELIGQHLGRYLIVDDLGRGGSSRVYRARDTEDGREVAIKVLPNDAEDRVGFVRRFEREVQVVRQLSHPNIVAVFDQGETQEFVYLVMQLVGGGTLRVRMGRPLLIPEATSAVAQMAFALHHAHVRGIIHRDVKPSNMLVDGDDPRHLLLTDFGIAKLQGLRGLTKSGTTIGTPEYMAPEQAEGREVDPRADVYSLGCVLYEALSGRPPFVAATPVSVLYQQVHSRPSYLRSFNGEVPRELSRIVEQALAKRPEERFATAERFAEALLPFAENELPPQVFPRETGVSGPAQIFRGGGDLSGPHGVIAAAGTDGAELPATDALPKGLGAEGLDAIFPEGPIGGAGGRRIVHSRPSTEADLRLGGPAREGQPRGPARQTIPLTPFHLPAKATRPLHLPLTADGRLDMEALMASVEDGRASRTASEIGEGAGRAPVGKGEARRATPPAGGQAGRDVQRKRGAPAPIWRPELSAARGLPPAAPERRRGGGRGPLFAGALVAALLLLALIVWVGVSTSAFGLAFAKRPGAHPTATSTMAPTARPTATNTATKPPAKATATPNPQAILDQEARASVRMVTLTSPQYDLTCSSANASTHFSANSVVYINVCMASQPVGDLVSVRIWQQGAVAYTLATGFYISPNDSHTFGHELPTGVYDAIVTVGVRGGEGTAFDIHITVG